jgi:hypothetical protein
MVPSRARQSVLVVSILVASAALGNRAVLAATDTVECGAIGSYVAPDPGTSTPGSIAFGFTGPDEPIAPDATLVGAVATNLPLLAGGTPTCLTVTRDSGVIKALAFAPEGTVEGPVTFVPDALGPGHDAYAIGDRIIVPVDILAMSSGLAALVRTPADAGTSTAITFQIDTATGFAVGFSGEATVSGSVTIAGNGDVNVGASTITADLIDATALAAFQQAVSRGVAATVTIHGLGSIDTSSGALSVAITLAISLPPLPSATPTPTPTAALLPDTATTR